jgi:hypothetical protein
MRDDHQPRRGSAMAIPVNSRIFLSHFSADLRYIYRIQTILHDLGHKVYMFRLAQLEDEQDPYKIWELIKGEILSSHIDCVVIPFRSDRTSIWTYIETILPQQNGKPVYPVKLDRCMDTHELLLERCLKQQVLKGLEAPHVDHLADDTNIDSIFYGQYLIRNIDNLSDHEIVEMMKRGKKGDLMNGIFYAKFSDKALTLTKEQHERILRLWKVIVPDSPF